ncbi:Transformer-2 like protein beta [Astathelohania contejeani]|uniref:Transformer-2 like protein beta n=1 Tax=Astathelohania contejeani TaxID=164912 RepID=A0ABQ7HZF4_9MICR|nr:Transformer-2 like protein beta [Thelohania contejeani]
MSDKTSDIQINEISEKSPLDKKDKKNEDHPSENVDEKEQVKIDNISSLVAEEASVDIKDNKRDLLANENNAEAIDSVPLDSWEIKKEYRSDIGMSEEVNMNSWNNKGVDNRPTPTEESKTILSNNNTWGSKSGNESCDDRNKEDETRTNETWGGKPDNNTWGSKSGNDSCDDKNKEDQTRTNETWGGKPDNNTWGSKSGNDSWDNKSRSGYQGRRSENIDRGRPNFQDRNMGDERSRKRRYNDTDSPRNKRVEGYSREREYGNREGKYPRRDFEGDGYDGRWRDETRRGETRWNDTKRGDERRDARYERRDPRYDSRDRWDRRDGSEPRRVPPRNYRDTEDDRYNKPEGRFGNYLSGPNDGDRSYRPRDYNNLPRPERVIPIDPPPSKVVGLFGLGVYATIEDVKGFLKECIPNIQYDHVHLVKDKDTGNSRGFGFIYFNSLDEAITAKEALVGKTLQGKEVRVDFSISDSPWHSRERGGRQ